MKKNKLIRKETINSITKLKFIFVEKKIHKKSIHKNKH